MQFGGDEGLNPLEVLNNPKMKEMIEWMMSIPSMNEMMLKIVEKQMEKMEKETKNAYDLAEPRSKKDINDILTTSNKMGPPVAKNILESVEFFKAFRHQGHLGTTIASRKEYKLIHQKMESNQDKDTAIHTLEEQGFDQKETKLLLPYFHTSIQNHKSSSFNENTEHNSKYDLIFCPIHQKIVVTTYEFKVQQLHRRGIFMNDSFCDVHITKMKSHCFPCTTAVMALFSLATATEDEKHCCCKKKIKSKNKSNWNYSTNKRVPTF